MPIMPWTSKTPSNDLQTYLETIYSSVADTFAKAVPMKELPEMNLNVLQKEVSFYANTSIASAQIRKLIIQEKETDYNLRPSFHSLYLASTGMLKSEILKQISKIVNQEIVTETSRAGLVGTINFHEKGFVCGEAWDSRNSLLILDEFTFGKKNREGWEVFLQLLESGHYSKRIAVVTDKMSKRDGDLYIHFRSGRIDLQTRFSCVIATMKKLEFRRGEDFRAFMTRVNPAPYNASTEALNDVANGKPIFCYQAFPVPQEITIPLKIYSQIKDCVNEVLASQTIVPQYIKKEVFMRSIGDICRVYAIYQKVDLPRWKQIVILKLWAQSRIGLYYRKSKDAEASDKKDKPQETKK